MLKIITIKNLLIKTKITVFFIKPKKSMFLFPYFLCTFYKFNWIATILKLCNYLYYVIYKIWTKKKLYKESMLLCIELLIVIKLKIQIICYNLCILYQ